MLLVFHLEGRDGLTQLKVKREVPETNHTYHLFHDFTKPNTGVTEVLARLARGLAFLVQKMLALQKDRRLKAIAVDEYLRSLSLHMCSESIQQAFERIFDNQNPGENRLQRWRTTVKMTDSDFPELSGTLKDVSDNESEVITKHLRDAS